MSKDITSPGLEEDTRTRREVIATEGGGVSAAKAASDVRKKKKVTDENVETSNLEQYILSQNIEKAANYFCQTLGCSITELLDKLMETARS